MSDFVTAKIGEDSMSVAKLPDAQDLKGVSRERKGAETLVFYWCFVPLFWLALGALGW